MSKKCYNASNRDAGRSECMYRPAVLRTHDSAVCMSCNKKGRALCGPKEGVIL